MVNQFWEYTFQCRFAPAPAGWVESGGTLCTGQEELESVATEFLDILNLRPEYNVYKAVYALAYALDNMLQCEPGRGPFSGNSCGNLQRLEPWQLVYYIEKVNFTTSFGDEVSFDENGDVLPIYDIMNWLWLPDGRTEIQTVGEVKKSPSKGEELTLDEEKIFWNFESKEPPRSVCSESCPPGTRMARKKGEPECCFDCIPCSEGEISNKTDSMECTSCPEDFWSSPQRDHCVPKTIDFLSYHEPLGICLTATSLLGTLICAVVLGIFIYHRKTPIGQFHLNGMHKAGDVVLGGLFEMNFFSTYSELSYTSEPEQPTCHGFDVLGFKQAQTMLFAIDEINRNPKLLPNVTLGYSVYDNCNKLGIGFRAALSLASGQEERVTLHETCVGAPPVLGIVGEDSSTRSIAISTVLGLYRVPLVSLPYNLL
ncbi:hypothetical protein INR49_016141 [Caranx melampygus]|nr:hypothetical protein INR49_016141 [Caranx melampygus]